jgi:5'-nucleotidase
MNVLFKRPLARTWLALGLLSFSAPSANAAPFIAPARRCIAVVGTNDLHGALLPTRRQAPSLTPPYAPVEVRTGGVLGLSGYVRALRQTYGERLLLLDAGDLFQGTLASNMSEGRAVIDAYNALGYAAAAIGNHEFDFGAGVGAGAAEAGPQAVLKARIAEANFPFLSLNLFDTATHRRIDWPNTRPSLLRKVGDVCVGILGISTVDTPKTTRSAYVDGLRFLPPAPLVEATARSLRQAGAELVVLVGHVGGACSDLSEADDPTSCRNGELLALLRQLPKGTVDVAIGGHTHQFIAHWIGDTATLESGARGNFLGYVDACVQPQGGIDRAASRIHGAQALCLDVWANGNCRPRRQALLPVRPADFLGQSVEPEPAMGRLLQPYLDAVQASGSQALPVFLARPLRAPELSRLAAEAMRQSTHSDFALQNFEGIRAELPAGPVTYGRVFEVLPFDNGVVQLQLSGAQLQQLVGSVRRHAGRFGRAVFAGLQEPPGGPPSLTRPPPGLRTSKGQPLEPDRLYTLATSDFLAEGGDAASALSSLPDGRKHYVGPAARQALIEYLTDRAAAAP